MDYKKLCKKLERAATRFELIGFKISAADCMEAVNAIETLLEDRDAAVEDLTQICQDSGDACRLCKHLPCVPKHDRCIGWQWRGPAMSDQE